jgi:hypothetical protein
MGLKIIAYLVITIVGLGLPRLSWGSQARSEALGDRGFGYLNLFEDVTDVGLFPSLAPKYVKENAIIGAELRSGVSCGYGLKRSQKFPKFVYGIALGIPWIYEVTPGLTNIPHFLKSKFIIGGAVDINETLAAGLLLSRTSDYSYYKNNTREEEYSFSINDFRPSLAYTAGNTGINFALSIPLTLRSYTWEQKIGAIKTKKEYKTPLAGIGAAGRISLPSPFIVPEEDEEHKIILLGGILQEDNSTKVKSNGKTIDEYDEKILTLEGKVGCLHSWYKGKVKLAYAIGFSRTATDIETKAHAPKEGAKTTSVDLIFPIWHIAVEGKIIPKLTLRGSVIAESEREHTEEEVKATAKKTTETSHFSPDAEVNLGLTYKLTKNVWLDFLLNNELVLNGPNFIAGFDKQPWAHHVSINAKF